MCGKRWRSCRKPPRSTQNRNSAMTNQVTIPSEERLHNLDMQFASMISVLHERLHKLVNATPFTYSSKPSRLPQNAVYLFSEEELPLYVGRTNKFAQRLGNHCRKSSTASQSSFAFRLAREAAGITEASYSGENTRVRLMERPDFANGFLLAKERLNRMQLRYVEEPDQTRQPLLEIYCAVALKTPYNEFGTH
jgi:hypothetical protein